MEPTEWSLPAAFDAVASAAPDRDARVSSERASHLTGALVDVDGGTDF